MAAAKLICLGVFYSFQVGIFEAALRDCTSSISPTLPHGAAARATPIYSFPIPLYPNEVINDVTDAGTAKSELSFRGVRAGRGQVVIN